MLFWDMVGSGAAVTTLSLNSLGGISENQLNSVTRLLLDLASSLEIGQRQLCKWIVIPGRLLLPSSKFIILLTILESLLQSIYKSLASIKYSLLLRFFFKEMI